MIWEQDCWGNCAIDVKRNIILSIWESRKPSTITKYCLCLRKFLQYCSKVSIEVKLPISSLIAAQYLNHVKRQSKSAVKDALTSLKWLHIFIPGLNSSNNPLNDDLLSRLVDSVNRNEVKEKSRKKPLTSEMINATINNLPKNPTLTELRDALIPALAFALLLRHDELSHLNFNHFTQLPEGLKIFIPSSKTDTYREGKYVFLSNENVSVYNLLFKYVSKSDHDFKSNCFFFAPISITKGSFRLENKKLSYDVFSKIIKQTVAKQGLNPEQYGTHSARSGGATALYPLTNQYEILLSGRWADPRSLGSYIEVSPSSRFEINSRLNLS